ncbi:MAG: ribonuclease Y [Planctomycetes bacterium]|nr:ribonuclease Y [Planctomycetota bacterium]
MADMTSFLVLGLEALGVTLTAAGAGVAGIVLGILLIRVLAGTTIRQANSERDRILEDARRQAETIGEKAELEAEKKALDRREKMEAEFASTRDELKENERRLTKREDNHDRKMDALILKERHLDSRARDIEKRERQLAQQQTEIEELVEQQREKLRHIADMTADQARDELLRRVEDESRTEVNALAMKIYQEAEEESKSRSRELVLSAIQRYAGEFAVESTVRSIQIPSDDMKGRIIGREGRNIRAIERATGVDVMVDDTPGLISVSCFDKVRQTIAVEALQKLVEDGRVHPTRIEEVVQNVTNDVHERIVRHGKEAATEAKIRGLHPKVIEAVGKLYFRTSFGQNILQHSIEVAYLSQIIADQLGLDGTLARRCGFLHDIGKAMDHDMEGGHPKIGMDFCTKFGERDEVLNAIGGHHADIPSTSPYTPIVMAADAVSGARPGARRESMEHYIQRLEQLESIAMEHQGVQEAYAVQAGREVRVILDAGKASDSDAFGMARSIAQRVSEEMTFPGEIKVTVIRETRAIEVAS